MKHPNLSALLQSDSEAKHYFETLPDYAKEQISARSNSVIKDYAQNLLRGDD